MAKKIKKTKIYGPNNTTQRTGIETSDWPKKSTIEKSNTALATLVWFISIPRNGLQT